MSSSAEKYDVFISFRGEDTRTNFTSHLYSALCRNDIRTYIDYDIKKGDNVGPILSRAIQDSHTAIVVFSENYASSKWCLEELVKILQCRKDKSHGQVVIPVFYDVDPSNIRNQTGSYGEAFAKHEPALGDKDYEKKKEKVSEWKAALNEAANISGWDSRSRDYKNDSELIQNIVDDVLQKLHLRYPMELEVEGLVGIDNTCEYVELLLSMDEDVQLLKNVKVIGIWGMGGIGKTTIAKAVFSRLFPKYDSVCFLANVREESQKHGQTSSLRDKLLFDLLKQENPKSGPLKSTFDTRRLSRKKVFIVLDDVNTLDQFDELYKVYKYVGPNSKIIMTTRNRDLLSGRVDKIYDTQIWSFDESLELFCLHAFRQRCPQDGYEDLSKVAVEYAGGVPLALKVLGSDLYSKSAEIWDDKLKKVKKYPHTKIENVLRVSYDDLDTSEQAIFLDIAFFFKGQNKNFVKRILNACNFYATSGIQVLEDKALVTITNDNKIQMHDLLQDMGLNIVRQGIENPGRHSRLMDIGEVFEVLQNKKGSDAVEGITLDLSHIDDLLRLSADAFNMMTELRILKLYIPSNKRSSKVDYPRVLNKISDKLRYLEWYGCGLKYLPSTFSAKMLVEIRMPHSNIIELWSGVQDVVNLEGIDLTKCKQMKTLPDLSKASKLKWVNLSSCESLLVVHPSILSLDTLQTLILDNCKKLENLISKKHFRSLENLSVNGCTSLREFSMSSDLIYELDLSKTGIQKLHSAIGNLTRLESLNLEGLRLRNLPIELSSLKCLLTLKISNCIAVMDKQMLHVLFGGLMQLQRLYLKDCCKLFELPDNICGLTKLYELRLDGSSVERLPESIRHMKCPDLSFNNCKKLRCLLKLSPFMCRLSAVNCTSLVTVSTLDTFAALMRGNDKYISFQNCMKLDGVSLHCIMEGTQLAMMNALFQNEYVDGYDTVTHSYNYTLVKVCLPGSRVPSQFTYRSTDSSCIVTLPRDDRLLGLILCAVLSPSPELKHGAMIWCQCYLADGREVAHACTWSRNATISELNSDHVYIWCDSYHYRSLSYYKEEQLSFKFYVTNDMEEPKELNIRIKECGVRLVFDSEEDLRTPLRGLYLELRKEYDLDLQEELKSKLGLDQESQYTETLTAPETSDEIECSHKNSQEQGFREQCSCSSDCFFDVLRYLWGLIRT